MDMKALTSIILGVLKDWRVIVIAILSVLVVKLAVYVVRYRKRPPRIRKPKEAPKAAAPKKEPAKEGQDQEGEGDGASHEEHK